MADQNESISEPVPPPSHPSPHALTPPGWDESAGFRETFFRHVTDAEDDRTQSVFTAAARGRTDRFVLRFGKARSDATAASP